MSGFVTINGQQIPWSFVMKVRKMFNGDYDRTVDLFYRARKAAPPAGVFGYVQACLRVGPDGKLNVSCSDEVENGRRQVVWDWWNGLRAPSRKRPESMAEILRGIVNQG